MSNPTDQFHKHRNQHKFYKAETVNCFCYLLGIVEERCSSDLSLDPSHIAHS